MKNLPRHTPGPWKADFPFVTTEDGTSICDVRHAGSFNKNEHLIAAAPDLLAACEAMETALTAYGYAISDMFGHDENFTTAREAVRDAIAKAKGN